MFRYPTDGLKKYTSVWREIIRNYDTSLIQKLDPFIKHVHEKPLSVQQEYFISTFDVQALCYLDVGYILFGEDFRRGVFLSHIKKEQELAGNNCGSELPDHLPNMLTLLPKLKKPDLAEELIYSVMIPAVDEMILSFRSIENVYRGLMEILTSIMKKDYPESDFEKFIINERKKSEFVQCYTRENNNLL
jgi:nitrate reductase assembly molybdenum cofactor insertion protein NarJ